MDNSRTGLWHVATWLLLASAITLHVADEAAHNFVDVHTQIGRHIRTVIPFFPVFTTYGWLLSNLIAISAMLLATIFVWRGYRWTHTVSVVLAFLIIVNALVHTLGSALMGYVLPGALTSPLLLVAAVGLWVASRRRFAQGEPKGSP